MFGLKNFIRNGVKLLVVIFFGYIYVLVDIYEEV